ncbi:arginine repressor [Streptococcus halotolerans]|uniref:arginine repressor n=1 Tax=Streptococcus halotolerans TaxID=1814128 RepID=UPI0007872FB2|nr:arginine repressor [Streptococcus halotolerans]
MNKIQRHAEIKRIITHHQVGTQEEIKTLLEHQDIFVTQATLSRDLREIGLIKLRSDEGKLYYCLNEVTGKHFSKRASDFVNKVSKVQFMLVLSTNLGEADVLANIIDQEERGDILGTVAGADTLLVICQNEETAETIYQDISAQL